MDRKIILQDLIDLKWAMQEKVDDWEANDGASEDYCAGFREAIDDLEIFIYNRQH